MNPYQALANAIVELAVKDYKTALEYYYRHPNNHEYEDKVLHLECFFNSGWYETLTDLNAEYLMNGVRRLVREEMAA